MLSKQELEIIETEQRIAYLNNTLEYIETRIQELRAEQDEHRSQEPYDDLAENRDATLGKLIEIYANDLKIYKDKLQTTLIKLED